MINKIDALVKKMNASIRRKLKKIKYHTKRLAVDLFGLDLYLDTDDRTVLEKIIIPYFVSRNEFFRILFIGCDWHTKPYRKYFKDKEYWTIDMDRNKSKYGSEKHIVDSLKNINLYFSDGYFDLIICNGVFGWGMDTREEIEESFEKCFQCLRDDGILIVGWNDIPERRPFPIEECQSLGKFEPSTLRYLITNAYRHTFNFYAKHQEWDKVLDENPQMRTLKFDIKT